MSIYWFYVIGNLSDTVLVAFILSLIPLGVLFITVMLGDYSYSEEKKKYLHQKWCKYISVFSSIMLIASIFGVSSETLMKIYVVDSVVEYIGEKDEARHLPDKVIECCNKLLDDYLNEDTDN